jgi:hypothetical protein
MARQREINSAAGRRIRTDDYLRNLYVEEEREKEEEKERARAKASQLEEQRIDRLAARAERIRLRTEDPLPLTPTGEYILDPAIAASSEVPYAVRRQRRLDVQNRRKCEERREEVSKDLARARALLDEERRKDELEIRRDIKVGYGSLNQEKRRGAAGRHDYQRRPESSTASILKSSPRRRFDLDDDFQSLGRSNGLRPATRTLSNGLSTRGSKEVHWND